MRVLVTGAGGFVGNHIANYLQFHNHEVTGIIHNKEANGDFKIVKCDLAKDWNINGNFDLIVNSAGALPYRSTDFNTYYRNNVVLMEKLIDFAVNSGVKRVINISSIGVYGEVRDKTVTEVTDSINLDGYGLTKYVAEKLLHSESNLKSISLRIPGIIGPGCRGVWLSNTANKFLKDETVEIYSPDFETKNFVWIDDLSRFIDRLISMQEWRYDIINLACAKGNSIRDIVSEIKHRLNSKSEIIVKNDIGKPFCIEPNHAIEMGYESADPLEIVKKYCEILR